MRYIALPSISFTARGLREFVSFTTFGMFVPGG
jgi:hypothetical protein